MPHDHATAVVAAATTSSGVAVWFDLLENGLALVAVLAGITLSVILIRKHWLELQVLEDEERRKEIRRKENGRPD